MPPCTTSAAIAVSDAVRGRALGPSECHAEGWLRAWSDPTARLSGRRAIERRLNPPPCASRGGFANLRFVHGDAQILEGIAGPFDAVVGRLVLMYLPDPAAALARATELVRPGGLVCCQEGDMAYEWAQPMTALWIQVRTWFLETLSRARIAQRMGLALPAIFAAAGLPVPELRLECALGASVPLPVWGWSNVVLGVVPLMEQLGG